MSLKKAIEHELGIPTRVRTGGPGSFNVLVNGEQVYSKKETGRMPAPSELLNLIRKHTTNA